jgi:hypothetical protein
MLPPAIEKSSYGCLLWRIDQGDVTKYVEPAFVEIQTLQSLQVIINVYFVGRLYEDRNIFHFLQCENLHAGQGNGTLAPSPRDTVDGTLPPASFRLKRQVAPQQGGCGCCRRDQVVIAGRFEDSNLDPDATRVVHAVQ